MPPAKGPREWAQSQSNLFSLTDGAPRGKSHHPAVRPRPAMVQARFPPAASLLVRHLPALVMWVSLAWAGREVFTQLSVASFNTTLTSLLLTLLAVVIWVIGIVMMLRAVTVEV